MQPVQYTNLIKKFAKFTRCQTVQVPHRTRSFACDAVAPKERIKHRLRLRIRKIQRAKPMAHLDV